ncbi:unnamed protein product [Allacma fusca]|uniref:Uncharacterized protein n=1 Tax=Allacma fusca TaxID=39272 RepID=A0A8J2JJN8_9HEXA|nr:unnamed protein product [Allacma fusca]
MKIFSLLFLVLFKGLNAKVIPSGEQGLGSRNDTKFWIMSISPIWLKELENTYKSGFPKNFGFTIHRNMSNVPNHNVPSGGGSTCQNVTFLSVEQNRRLVNKYGWNSVFNSTTQEMLRNPRARLYSYQGDTEDYRFLRINLSDDDNISKWYYGRIINEHPTKLKRDQPYVQDIDQRKVTKKNLHYIHMNFSPVFQSLESSDFNKFPGSNYNNVAGNRMPSVLNCQQVISSDEDSAEHNGLNKRSMKKHEEFMDPLTWDVQKITEMLHNPMVRLFTGANFSGTFENYHSGMDRNYSGCHETRQVRSVKSAATLNKCTRLFTLKDCRGLSLAIYPGLGNSNVPLDILSQVMSIGPCIVEDFVENKNTSGAIPDIFAISETPTSNSDLYRGDRLEVQYTLGPKNRIENLVASIFQPGLVDITEFLNVEETNFYKSRDTEPGDIPNFVIPIEIGGPQDFLFNIFPMHQSMVNTWAEIFPSSFSDPNEIFHWHMTFKFLYDTDSHTRPMSVYYYFRDEINRMIYYARFVNS